VVAQRPAEQKFQRQVMERRFRLGKPTLLLRQEFLGHSVGIHRKAGEAAQWRPSTALTFEQRRCIFPRPPTCRRPLIVGARSQEQVPANVTSMQTRIPPEFWAELKRQKLIEENAPTPT
jgi:hypothetical protein